MDSYPIFFSDRRVRLTIKAIFIGVYSVSGLFCFLHDFSAAQIAFVLGAQGLLFCGLRQSVASCIASIRGFAGTVAGGLLITWFAWAVWGVQGAVGFPFFILGAVLWSIVFWFLLLCIEDNAAKPEHRSLVSLLVEARGAYLFLILPIAIATSIGFVVAVTDLNSPLGTESLTDALSVAGIGVALGFLLAAPWWVGAFTLGRHDGQGKDGRD
jgi:hypothetical protein